MSSYYRCSVVVEGIAKDKLRSVANAIKAYWSNFKDDDFYFGGPGLLDVTGEGSVSGPIDDFAQNIAIAVWKANQDKCEVTVDTVYMEELPTDSFHFDESDYIKIMAKA